MPVLLLVVAMAAVAVVGWLLWRRVGEVEDRLVEIRELRHTIEELDGELARGLAVTRSHLARVAAGDAPAAAAIREGRAFEDVQPAPALVLWQQERGLAVLDVRTEAEFRNGHIPGATLVPVDELEDRLGELPARDARILVTCAVGGRSLQACSILADHGWTNLLNLVGGMHAWPGPCDAQEPEPPPANLRAGTSVRRNGGDISEAAVVEALRQCFDPEIPLNIYDLGLIYDVDLDADRIAVTMTLTSEACPSARAIPADVKARLSALGASNVSVDVTFDPPWHPARISPDGKQKLGLA
jgi:metal-sulfur cluster biosynthetic enzyme/rhodanese-related sulfurtransferase